MSFHEAHVLDMKIAGREVPPHLPFIFFSACLLASFPSLVLWIYSCVTVWLCGCLAVWLCGCVAVWLCGCLMLIWIQITMDNRYAMSWYCLYLLYLLIILPLPLLIPASCHDWQYDYMLDMLKIMTSRVHHKHVWILKCINNCFTKGDSILISFLCLYILYFYILNVNN